MRKLFVDTETAGLHGVIVKIQWEFDDDGVNMLDAWLTKVSVMIELIEEMVKCHVIAHNLRFDWFHLSKWYHMCKWVLEHHGDVHPIDVPMEDMIEAEWQSQFGDCLKPPAATCTLLLCQSGELQTLMNRKAIVIKRQPIQLQDRLLAHLEELTAHLPTILFARQEDPFAPRWKACEIKNEENGKVEPDFVDIKLVFKPSNALKDIAEFVLGYEPKFRMKDIDVPREYAIPADFAKMGYMPFARLAGPDMWPNFVHGHIKHWATDKNANTYAHDDIPLLKALYQHLGHPDGDRYGMLACQIASSRLAGMEVDLEEVKKQLKVQEQILDMAPVNVDSHVQVRQYIADAMDDTEALRVARSAKRQVLEAIVSEYVCEEEEECGCEIGCPRCDCKHAADVFEFDLEELKNSPPKKDRDIPEWEEKIKHAEEHIALLRAARPGFIPPGPMPVTARIREIQRTRKSTKRAQVYRKLIQCQGRMYPSFNPIGAKSGRLSGADGMNFQAIGSEETMRNVFKLHGEDTVLSMGDYSSLEIIIAIVVYGDDILMKDVESGKSLHALMACELYDMTYEQVMASKGTKNDVYKLAKVVVYSLLYGATIAGIANKLTLPTATVQKAYDNFVKKYPGVAKARRELAAKFTAISQPGGRGTEVFWTDPDTFVESMFGFRRDFSIEFDIARLLFKMANSIPKEWKEVPGRSVRYGDRPKAYWQHVSSGLFGAAANSIQGGVIRAALNHIIQSTGNHLTVGLQESVWTLQPVGIHPFLLTLMSIHDELCVVSKEDMVDKVTSMVHNTIEAQREDVPLLAMDWMTHATSWAGKTNKQGKKFAMGWQLEEENAK